MTGHQLSRAVSLEGQLNLLGTACAAETDQWRESGRQISPLPFPSGCGAGHSGWGLLTSPIDTEPTNAKSETLNVLYAFAAHLKHCGLRLPCIS